MSKSRVIVVIGVLVALLPLLGFPHAWEAVFQVLAGLAIVLLSVWATIDKKIKLQAKVQQRLAKTASLASEAPNSPETDQVIQADEVKEASSGRRVTDFYPKTAPPGRRLTDFKR